jgi:hypothetical protein
MLPSGSCQPGRARQSGLWNSNHVDERYGPGFIELLARLAQNTR